MMNCGYTGGSHSSKNKRTKQILSMKSNADCLKPIQLVWILSFQNKLSYNLWFIINGLWLMKYITLFAAHKLNTFIYIMNKLKNIRLKVWKNTWEINYCILKIRFYLLQKFPFWGDLSRADLELTWGRHSNFGNT